MTRRPRTPAIVGSTARDTLSPTMQIRPNSPWVIVLHIPQTIADSSPPLAHNTLPVSRKPLGITLCRGTGTKVTVLIDDRDIRVLDRATGNVPQQCAPGNSPPAVCPRAGFEPATPALGEPASPPG
jgi:hypothetical protein